MGSRRSFGVFFAHALLGFILVGCGAAPAAAPPAAAPAKAPAQAALPTQLSPAAPPAAAPPAAAPAKAPAQAALPTQVSPAAPPAAPAGGAPKQLTMGSTQASSGSYPYFVATAKIVNTEVPELAVTVAESGASVENVNRMAQGTFQLGQASTDILYKALNGLDQWAGKPVSDLRMLWVYDITAQAFVVREDSAVKKPEDLDGRDFNPGMRGSATETLARATLGVLGIKPKLYVAGTEDAVAAIKDKRIVGYVKGTSPSVIDPTILDVSVNTSIRLLAFSKAQLEKTLAAHPYFSTTEIPAGVYKGDWNAQPLPMLAQVQAMAVRANDLSEDHAYRVTKAVIEDNRPGGKGLQAAARPAIKGVDLAKLTIDNSLTPLHAGAQRYFAEIGLTISDRLRSPEAK